MAQEGRHALASRRRSPVQWANRQPPSQESWPGSPSPQHTCLSAQRKVASAPNGVPRGLPAPWATAAARARARRAASHAAPHAAGLRPGADPSCRPSCRAAPRAGQPPGRRRRPAAPWALPLPPVRPALATESLPLPARPRHQSCASASPVAAAAAAVAGAAAGARRRQRRCCCHCCCHCCCRCCSGCLCGRGLGSRSPSRCPGCGCCGCCSCWRCPGLAPLRRQRLAALQLHLQHPPMHHRRQGQRQSCCQGAGPGRTRSDASPGPLRGACDSIRGITRPGNNSSGGRSSEKKRSLVVIIVGRCRGARRTASRQPASQPGSQAGSQVRKAARQLAIAGLELISRQAGR
jgi:hypothetical protein